MNSITLNINIWVIHIEGNHAFSHYFLFGLPGLILTHVPIVVSGFAAANSGLQNLPVRELIYALRWFTPLIILCLAIWISCIMENHSKHKVNGLTSLVACADCFLALGIL